MAREILTLESATERKFVKHVESLGYHAIKIIKRGWPDRFIQLRNGYGFYIEFKRKGEKPRKLQEYIHKEIKAMGCHVYVCDSYEEAVRGLRTELTEQNHIEEVVSEV